MNKKTILFLALLLTLSLNWACWAQESNVPTTELKINGLKEKVFVRRDYRGIPYIEARNEADLYFAQGFVTAQDRLWQMDLYRRVARGETADRATFANYTVHTSVPETHDCPANT